MTDIQFYHLTSPLERVLPKLLEKSLAGGFKTRVKFDSEEKAEWMNNLLWTYNPDSFLPHGTAKDGHVEMQPVYLTAGAENPNRADIVIITDGSAVEADADVKRVLDIVDANDAAALASAESRARGYEAQKHSVSCIRQNAAGGWEKAA